MGTLRFPLRGWAHGDRAREWSRGRSGLRAIGAVLDHRQMGTIHVNLHADGRVTVELRPANGADVRLHEQFPVLLDTNISEHRPAHWTRPEEMPDVRTS